MLAYIIYCIKRSPVNLDLIWYVSTLNVIARIQCYCVGEIYFKFCLYSYYTEITSFYIISLLNYQVSKKDSYIVNVPLCPPKRTH